MDGVASPGGKQHALRLLSLDGGGIRGISELIILDEIMHRVQRVQKLSYVPLPADYFDLICGTSTGGLIALLLGRLRLSVPEAIDKYRQLAEQVFSDKKTLFKDGKFKASNLERAIKEVVEWKLGKGHADEKMFASGGKNCKTFVCAVPATHINREPKLFRSWSADKNPGYNCTIWEAGRATSAAPTFFKRISIGSPGMQEEFVDAGVGCNNPVQYLIQEAQREFGSKRDVACIVSIGTGKPEVAGFKAPSLFQRVLPLDLIRVLKSITTDSEAVASIMETRYRHCDGIYHRLNVERGLEQVSLEEWKKLGEVTTHTLEYLRAERISQNLDVIVDSLVGKASRSFTLGELDGSVLTVTSTLKHFIYPSYKVNHFVEREGLLDKIGMHLHGKGNPTRPIIFVLLGMGGCGKSQLALEYCHQASDNGTYSAIFWIDVTSPTTAQQGFAAAAQALSKAKLNISDDEANLQFVRRILGAWDDKWLLIFDNFDDPASFKSKSIKDYFPQQGMGSILVTGRHEEGKSLGHHVDISIMSDTEALELLFRRSKVDRIDTNLRAGREIVSLLGFHALAIDQAGAYILARNLDVNLFLTHFHNRKEKVLSEAPDLWDYRRAAKGSPELATNLTAFTTWELSFDLIRGNEVSRNDKEHILTLIAFFDRKRLLDTIFTPYASKNGHWMFSCRRDNEWGNFELQDILKELRSLSLFQSLQIDGEGASFSLHPLIQDWIKLRARPESRRSFVKEAVNILGAFLGDCDLDAMPLTSSQITLAHAEAVLTNIYEYLDQSYDLKDETILDSLSHVSWFLCRQGRYRAAEKLQRVLCEESKQLLGDEHPQTLAIMSLLAHSLTYRGEYNEAEHLLRQLLEVLERVLGKEANDTLMKMDDLAELLIHKGENTEAELLCRQTLALKEKVLGKEAIDTLVSARILAQLLVSKCEYAEAEPMCRQNLALREKLLGKEHYDTLGSMFNLGELFRSQGKYTEAETMYRQVLAVLKRTLGIEHPNTLICMSNLSTVLCKQGMYDEAEALCRQAFTGRERLLGLEHPVTLEAFNYLGDLLEARNDLEDAAVLFRRTLRESEVLHGPSSSVAMVCLRRLAAVLEKMGKSEEAETLRHRLVDAENEWKRGPRNEPEK